MRGKAFPPVSHPGMKIRKISNCTIYQPFLPFNVPSFTILPTLYPNGVWKG